MRDKLEEPGVYYRILLERILKKWVFESADWFVWVTIKS
jgi:hypothetical protein